jgi:hypothetical protein
MSRPFQFLPTLPYGLPAIQIVSPELVFPIPFVVSNLDFRDF